MRSSFGSSGRRNAIWNQSWQKFQQCPKYVPRGQKNGQPHGGDSDSGNVATCTRRVTHHAPIGRSNKDTRCIWLNRFYLSVLAQYKMIWWIKREHTTRALFILAKACLVDAELMLNWWYRGLVYQRPSPVHEHAQISTPAYQIIKKFKSSVRYSFHEWEPPDAFKTPPPRLDSTRTWITQPKATFFHTVLVLVYCMSILPINMRNNRLPGKQTKMRICAKRRYWVIELSFFSVAQAVLTSHFL